MRRVTARVGVLVGAALLFAVNSRAEEPECKKVHATLEERQFTNDCTSPKNVCVAGTIDGNQGLTGTTLFVLDSSTAGPSTAIPVTVAYSGIFEITTADGVLSLRETGINGPRTGGGRIFASVATVLSGTGRYAGATGSIFFNGTNLVVGVFETTMTGEVCYGGSGQ